MPVVLTRPHVGFRLFEHRDNFVVGLVPVRIEGPPDDEPALERERRGYG